MMERNTFLDGNTGGSSELKWPIDANDGNLGLEHLLMKRDLPVG